MADQISIRLDETNVAAGSAVVATVNFRTRSTAAASTPTSIRYRVDCLTNHRQIIADTSVSAASSVSITVPGPNNGIIDESNETEKRQITVIADYGLDTQVKAASTWTVRNIRTFIPGHVFNDDFRIEPYYPITAAEEAAGLDEDDFAVQYPPGDVRRYGAVGDGSTDDTDALQAALTVSRTHPMVLPPLGSDSLYYKITSELLIPGTGAQIIGSGYLSIIRQATASANVFSRASGGSTIFNVTIRDVHVGVAGNITGGTGFNLEGIANSDLFNCRVIADSADQGLLIGFRCWTTDETGRYSYINEFHNCRVRTAVSANARGYLIGGTAGDTSNSNHIFGGEVRADSGKGVYLFNSGTDSNGVPNQNTIMGVSFEGTTDTAVDVEGGFNVSQANLILGCRFEGPTNGVRFRAGSTGNTAAFNLYSSGLTVKVDDAGEYNLIAEPTSDAGSLITLSRGSFQGKTKASGAFGIFDAIGGETAVAFAGAATGDSVARFTAKNNGRLEWGSGSATADVSLHRTATAELEVDIGFLKLTRAYVVQATAANIADKTNAINTAGKFNGKMVWDTTNHRLMTTEGTSDVAPWYAADGATTVVPA